MIVPFYSAFSASFSGSKAAQKGLTSTTSPPTLWFLPWPTSSASPTSHFGALLSLHASLTSAGFCPAATGDPINVHALSSSPPPFSETVTKEINGLHIHHHYTVRGLWILIEYIKSRRALLCRYGRFHLSLKIEILLCEASSRDNWVLRGGESPPPVYTNFIARHCFMTAVTFPICPLRLKYPFCQALSNDKQDVESPSNVWSNKRPNWDVRVQFPSLSISLNLLSLTGVWTNKRKYYRNFVLTLHICWAKLISVFGRLIFFFQYFSTY